MDDYEELRTLIEKSIIDLYRNESDLFHVEPNETNKNVARNIERCKVFHFGRFLCNYIENSNILKNYNVDVEYGRMFENGKLASKKLKIAYDEDSKEEIHDVVPDLIVHRRGNNDNNLAVFEIKCNYPNASSKKRDRIKLKKYIESLNYKYAFYIELNENEGDFKINKV